ncbi:hypothetical protein HDU79_003554 [Rhizoclosmatium sp. JEL0117]|nr:hypothetical protein HDU99_002465 [Rhizoclosmatium hyalinum]KAJ3297472.1 hypothetical protein HDU79_003554 [Rhizoclosmatium sp. JEL0117]
MNNSTVAHNNHLTARDNFQWRRYFQRDLPHFDESVFDNIVALIDCEDICWSRYQANNYVRFYTYNSGNKKCFCKAPVESLNGAVYFSSKCGGANVILNADFPNAMDISSNGWKTSDMECRWAMDMTAGLFVYNAARGYCFPKEFLKTGPGVITGALEQLWC